MAALRLAGVTAGTPAPAAARRRGWRHRFGGGWARACLVGLQPDQRLSGSCTGAVEGSCVAAGRAAGGVAAAGCERLTAAAAAASHRPAARGCGSGAAILVPAPAADSAAHASRQILIGQGQPCHLPRNSLAGGLRTKQNTCVPQLRGLLLVRTSHLAGWDDEIYDEIFWCVDLILRGGMSSSSARQHHLIWGCTRH